MHTLSDGSSVNRVVTRRGSHFTPARVWQAAGLAAATAALAFCYLRIAATRPVVSDGAGNALEAWSMLHGNPLLRGWWATDVSFLTTGLPQLIAVEAVTGLRPGAVHIAAAATYTLLLLLAAYAARGRATGREGVSRALLAVVIMLAPQLGEPTYLVLGSPDHLSVALPVLAAFLVLERAPRRWWAAAVIGGVLAFGLVGDQLVLVVGVLPLVAVCLARALPAWRRTRRVLGYELSLAAAAALAVPAAWLANFLIAAAGGLRVNKLRGMSPLHSLGNLPLGGRDVLSLFGADPWGAPGGPQVVFAAIHLLGAGAVTAALVLAALRLGRSLARTAGRRQDLVPDLVSDLLVTGIAANLLLFFVLYRATSQFAAEEVAPVLALGAALTGRQLGGPLARAAMAGSRRRRTLLRLALAAVAACYVLMLGYAAAQPPQPPANHALLGWLHQHRLRHGLAGYWHASSVALISGGAVNLIPVQPDRKTGLLAGYRWETDARMFDARTHYANFLVLTVGGNPPTVWQTVTTFGRPAKVYHFEIYTIMIWHKNLLADLAPPIPR